MTKDTPPLDPVRKLIVDRIAALKTNMSVVSRQIGRSHAYLQQFLKRGIPKNLPEIERYKLADVLGVEEWQLEDAELSKLREDQPNVKLSGAVHLKNRIPAYGQAMTGSDGRFVFNGQKVIDVLAPPVLADVAEAYAVVIAGASMEPRYFAGEYAFVHPRLAVRKNDFVVVQLKPEHDGDDRPGYVKRFISLDSKRLRLEQLNPRKIIEFPANRVHSIHRIVMSGDGIL